MKNSSRIKLGLLSVAILSSLSLITGYNVVSASEQNIPLYTTNQTNTNLKVLLTDGALIRTSDTGIYLLENGVKYPFINPEIFDSYNYSYQNVEVIDKATFDLIPTGKAMPIRSGMLIRANTSPNVYVIEDGMKRRIDNPGVLLGAGYKWSDVRLVSQATVDIHPTEFDYKDSNWQVNGSLVTANGQVAKIEDGKLRPFPDVQTFLSNYKSWDMVRPISVDLFNKIPRGEMMRPQDRSLISDSKSVYLIENDTKRGFTSQVEFLNYGFKFDKILPLNQTLVSEIAYGGTLDTKDTYSTKKNSFTLAKNNVVDLIINAENYSILRELLIKADMVEEIQTNTTVTILAPTNQAFQLLPKETLDNLIKPENKASLQALLRYHIIQGNYKVSDVRTKVNETKNSIEVQTSYPQRRMTLFVDINKNDSQLCVNEIFTGSPIWYEFGATGQSDIMASNGVIHSINKVLVSSK